MYKEAIIKAIKNFEDCCIIHGERMDQCANGFIAETIPYLHESRSNIVTSRKALLDLLSIESK